MDGLSVAANIIAVISAAQIAAQGLQKLYSLRKAPQQVIVLLGEVSDLETVLSLVKETSEQLLLCDQFQDPIFNEYLKGTVRKALNVLNEVNAVVESGLIKNLDHMSNERVKISWKIWLRKHGYLTLVSSTLRNVKTDIASALTLLTASEVPRLRASMLKMSLENQNTLHGLQSLEREIAPLSPTFAKLQSTLECLLPKHPAELQLPPWHLRPQHPSPQYVQIQNQQHAGCNKLCICRCHEPKTFNSPLWTRSLFGQLFLAYSGKMLSQNHNCNIIACQEWKSKQIVFKATYMFPSWLLRRVVFICDRWSPMGHVISVRTPRTVPDNQLFYAAQMGKIRSLQKAFETGTGSPFDISRGRRSLIWYAVAFRRVETCRFLLQNYADPDQEDDHSRSAVDEVITYLIVDPLNPVSIELKELFSSYLDINESLGKRRFSNLHKMVLGLSPNSVDLEAYLQLSTAEIESRCTRGKTPLMWATIVSNTGAMKSLLKYGAKIDVLDDNGNNMLHLTALGTGDVTESLTLILKVTAALGLLEQMINQPGKSGVSPLNALCLEGKSNESVALLLNHGAFTEPQPHSTLGGIASIFYAIDHNHHAIIQLLLEAGAKTDVKDNLQKSILHIAAEDADLKTIRIFSRTQPPIAIETRDIDVFGLTPMETFEKHCDNFQEKDGVYKPKRRKAFVELLEQIEKSYLEKQYREESENGIRGEGQRKADWKYGFIEMDEVKLEDESDEEKFHDANEENPQD